MKLDRMVIKRFEDLAAKAKEVEATVLINDTSAVVDSNKFQEWATEAMNLLQRVFGAESVHYHNFDAIYSKIINIAYLESFNTCKGILKAAQEDYAGGNTFELHDHLHEAVLKYISGQASELLQSGQKEAACILSVVALESTLKELCERANVPVGSHEEMNKALYKAGAYTIGTQQRVSDWGCIRDDVLRGLTDQYSISDVDVMLKGIERFMVKHLNDASA